MNKLSVLIVAIIINLCVFSQLPAAPAAPGLKNLTMPDGSTLKVRLIGDERVHWFETADGYSIVENSLGYFEYATRDAIGALVPSGIALGKVAPPEKKHLKPSHEFIRSKAMTKRLLAKREVSPVNITGTEDILVLPIEFTDVKHGTNHDNKYLSSLFFGDSIGQLTHYFKAISYDQLNIAGSVADWTSSKRKMGYYGVKTGGSMAFIDELVREAVDNADPYIDYSDFDKDGDGYVDHLSILHAGSDYALTAQGNEIWSHSWAITPYMTQDGVYVSNYIMTSEENQLGTHAHEFMHDLGAPDLYDSEGDGEPVSSWCIMDYGTYGGTPPGALPSQLCGYLKNDMDGDSSNGYVGWLSVETASLSGDYTITQLSDTTRARLYKVDVPNDNEYFLIENRQLTGYDASLPDSGIVIWHVDEAMPDGFIDPWMLNNGTPYNSFYRISVEDPGKKSYKDDAAFSSEDGQTKFNKITSPGSGSNQEFGTGISISRIGASEQHMTFRLSITAPNTNLPPEVSVLASATSGSPPLLVKFTGTALDDDGEIDSYKYDFGDGGTSTEESVTHTFSDSGTFTVTFSATDDSGETSSTQVTIKVGSSSKSGCLTTQDIGLPPPSNGQILLDMMVLMLPVFFVVFRRLYYFHQ